MRSTQDKVLAQIEQAATAYGLELIIDKKAGNAGELRIEATADFVPVLQLTFSFQDSYFIFDDVVPQLPEFRINDNGKQRVGVWFPATENHPTTADGVIKAIRNLLARRKQKLEAEEYA